MGSLCVRYVECYGALGDKRTMSGNTEKHMHICEKHVGQVWPQLVQKCQSYSEVLLYGEVGTKTVQKCQSCGGVIYGEKE